MQKDSDVLVQDDTERDFPFQRRGNPLNPPLEYARLRAEQPLAKVTLWDGSTAWIATRWEDVRVILGSPHFSVDPFHPGYPSISPARAVQARSRQAFINMDDPNHARFRRMLTKDFMQKRMSDLRPMVRKLVDELIDGMVEHGPPVDFVKHFSQPLPSMVISALLGVPYEDHATLGTWSNTRNDHTASPEVVQQAVRNMEAHLGQIIAQKEADPGDGSDMLSRLVIEQIRPGNVTREEVVRIASLLYSAGHGTTSSQIGLGTLSLLMNPDQRAELEADPSLLSSAVEEMLRFHTIAHFNSARVATGNVMIGGQQILAGEGVYPLIFAANRDPAVFPNPDSFDIHRNPQEHVAFAYGIHQCLGQPLARLELHTVFGMLFKRLPELKLAVPVEALTFNSTSQVYRLETLPVTW
ncbi:cytochrome P450 [Paraburkholderia hospita]|uniref:cytochrome P450 n=1 Tax=Paraburkholderia hospita TaxID=169430 RepID=UPI003ECDB4F1